MNETIQIKRRHIMCTLPVWPFQHCKMSLQAKGLLALLLSFPDNWKIRMGDIISRSSNGRDATRTALKELISQGYVWRERIRDGESKKYIGCMYFVTDNPRTDFQAADFQAD